MPQKLLFAVFGIVFCASAVAAGSLENPQPASTESGIGVISGWYCPAAAITFQIDASPPIVAPYGSSRADTSSLCGGNIATGFSNLFNYNTLTPGAHTIKVFADGVQFGSASFTTVTLGAEFLSGKAGEYYLNNFPDYGKRSRVTWQQSKQNFVVTKSDTQVAALDGTYFGAITTINTGCTTATNNGNFVDFYRLTVTFGAQSLLTVIAANSAATCTFTGTAFYSSNGGDIVVQPPAAFSCTNGAQGTWEAERMAFDPIGLLFNMKTKYTVGETCSTVSHFAAAR